MTDREVAIKWWRNEPAEIKQFCVEWNSVGIDDKRSYKTMTGREIELLWNWRNNLRANWKDIT